MASQPEQSVPAQFAQRARGRPRAFDVTRALACARALFEARGYDQVSLFDLTTAMGINPPSFYAAFGNKAQLFGAVLEGYRTEWFAQIRDGLEREAPLRDRLGDLLLFAAHRFSRPEDEHGEPLKARDAANDVHRLPPPRGGCLILEAALNCGDPEVAELARKARIGMGALFYRAIAKNAPERAALLTDYMLMQLAGLSALAREGTSRYRLYATAQMAGAALPMDLG